MKSKFIGDWDYSDYPSHSFRNFEVGKQFSQAIQKCKKLNSDKSYTCKKNVRAVYLYVEAGRLKEMGNKIHSFVASLDPDEKESFKKNFSDSFKIAQEYGLVEEMEVF